MISYSALHCIISLILTFNFGGWSPTAGLAGLDFGARGNPIISCSMPLQRCTSTLTSGKILWLWLYLSIFFFWKLKQIVQSKHCKILNWWSDSQTTKTNSRLCSLVTKSTNLIGNTIKYFPFSHKPKHELPKCCISTWMLIFSFSLAHFETKITICLINMTVIFWFQKNKTDLLTNKARKSNGKYHEHCIQY